MNTVGCTACRTFDTYLSPSAQNEMQLDYNGTNSVIDPGIFSTIQVFGSKLNFGSTKTSWNMSLNLGDGLVASPATTYFMYLAENGSPSITDKFPLQRKDLLGLYHPHETWRCIGSVKTDNSTNFVTNVKTFRGTSQTMQLADPEAYYAFANGLSVTGVANSYPTRFIQQMTSSPATINTSNWVDLATISLTPGLWRIDGSANAQIVNGTIGVASNWQIGLSTNQGTAPGAFAWGYNGAFATFSAFSGLNTTYAASNLNFSYLYAQGTAATTYYFKLNMNNINTTVATVSLEGWNIMAQRLDDQIGGPA